MTMAKDGARLLSVVVISWNSLSRLRVMAECLSKAANSLLADGWEMEVIWVDNGSTDGSSDYIRRHHPDFQQLILPRNYGVATGRNRGAALSRGEYILFLDDDTEFSANPLRRMLEHMDSEPGCGVSGVALRNAHGELQQSFKRYPGLGVKLRNLLLSWRGDKADTARLPKEVIHPEYIIGACQMIRREAWAAASPLDEKIFYGPEDADFCLRLAEAGWTVDFIPDESIIHHWRHTSRRNPFSRLSRMHLLALIHFYRKHRRWW